MMSTSRGNHNRSRPQKHQNRTAFRNDLHDTSKRTKVLNSIQVSGVCKRCKDIIEWKIKYKKYKPLNGPSKCVECGEKTVKYAYHVLCGKCAKEKTVCTKCCKPVNNDEPNEKPAYENSELQSMLKTLPERKRRTVLRLIERQQNGDPDVTSELIDGVISQMDKVNVDDDLDSISGEDSTYSDE